MKRRYVRINIKLFSFTNPVLYSPHVGGYLRQNGFYGCRAADQGRIDTVFGDRSRLLAHFGNLEERKKKDASTMRTNSL